MWHWSVGSGWFGERFSRCGGLARCRDLDRHDTDLVAQPRGGGLAPSRDRHRHDVGRHALAAALQHGGEGPADGGEQDVVDGRAVRVGRVADRAEVGPRDDHAPVRAGRLVERAARWPGGAARPELGDRVPYQPCRPRAAPVPPAAGRWWRRGTGAASRRRRGEGNRGAAGAPSTSRASTARPPIPSARAWCSTRTSAAAAAGRSADEGGRPQRPAPRQAIECNRGGDVEEGRIVAGRRAVPAADMLVDVELRVVDPDRAAASEGSRHEALTQSRYGADAFGECAAQCLQVQRECRG